MTDASKATGVPSPRPWRLEPVGTCVPGYDVCPRITSCGRTDRCDHDPISDADAALIVAAVNAYGQSDPAKAALVEALTAVVREFADIPGMAEMVHDERSAVMKAREALKLASGEKT